MRAEIDVAGQAAPISHYAHAVRADGPMLFVSGVVPVDELASEVTRFTDLIGRAPRDVLLRTKAKATRRPRTSPNPARSPRR